MAKINSPSFQVFFCFLFWMLGAASYAATPAATLATDPLTATNQTSHTIVTAGGQGKGVARLWNLQDADILSVINEVSQETGKNFIVDPRVSGKITLVSSKPLKPNDVYQVFLSILSMLGYSAIPTGNVVKIVPNMESGEQVSKLVRRLAPGKGDEVVVRVVALENISATQMIPVLRPMLPQWSNIAAYTPGNILILIGRANTLSRIVSVIEEVDSQANNNIQIVHLKHASAAQVAMVLNNLQNAARSTGETPVVSIAVDDRSNSVLLSGPKVQRLKIRLLIAKLDAPASSTGNTEVVYLRYLQAKTFAPVLSRIAQNIMGKGASASGGYEPPSMPGSPSMGGMQGANAQMNAGKEEEPVNSGSIQYEQNTNAIIITAPPTLMVALRSVIAKLDIRPAQVLVEAIITEIDENNLRNLGIQWGGMISRGDQFEQSGLPTDIPNFGPGVFGIIHGKHIKAVLNLLENLTGADILSTPQIVVLDNQKATIEVGKDVPIQTGSYAPPGSPSTSSGAISPFNTFDRKKVTLKLDVTPQISMANAVKLLIDLKNDTLQNPDLPTTNPLINTSAIKNQVIVNSDDILVLGGLISNTSTENINKIPILGDLPAIGPLLFQQKGRKLERRKLMVFIKTTIMHDRLQSDTLTYDKYMQTRKSEANFREDMAALSTDQDLNLLPPWKNKKDLPDPFFKDKPV